MKKIISQILLILLIITIGMTSVFINKANAASQAGLNVSSATEGGTFNVSLIFPSHYANVSGATATITVIYKDGTKDSQRLVYMEGMSDCPNLVTFTAKVAGTATIKATEIDISDADSNLLEQGESKEQTITIVSKTPPPTTTPDPEPEQPSAPDPGQNGSGTTTNNNNTTANTTTNTTTNTSTNTNTVTNTTREPQIVNPTFKEVNETVYATKNCNVRSSCSTEISSNKIGSLLKGQSVTRTGVEDTWSRIEYNGKVAYVATRLLTTEEPVEEEPENTVNENTISDNTVENNEIENNEMLNQIEQQIGVLPEVGHNVATIMFVIISILSLIVIMRLEYKSKE